MTAPTIIGDEAGRQRILNEIAHLDLEQKRWEITVKRHRKRRSNAQNNLYHAWVDEVIAELSDFTGYEKFEVKKLFKDNFLEPGREIQIKGMSTLAEPTTTTLDTKEMSEYMDKIYRWVSSEFGFALRLPPERGYEGDGHATDSKPRQQANGDDDWRIIAADIVKLIAEASNLDRLEEITAIYEGEFNDMKDDSPAHYTRVMRSMERRGEELSRQDGTGESAERAQHPTEAG